MNQAKIHLRLLQQAFRDNESGTPLASALARLREPFLVGEGGVWMDEGFIGFFHALHEAIRAVDPSVPPGLPPHCLDPAQIARFFRLPAKGCRTPDSTSGPHLAEMLDRIERKIDRVNAQRPKPTPESEYVSLQGAAAVTGLSYSHVRRAVLAGELPASNSGSPGRPVYRIARTDLAEWMGKRKGGAKAPPKSVLDDLVNSYFPGR